MLIQRFFCCRVWKTLLILAVCRTCVTTNSVNMTYARHESLSSSVVRASDRCTEGHGFDSRWGLRFFLCPTLATRPGDTLNIPSFLNVELLFPPRSTSCNKNVFDNVGLRWTQSSFQVLISLVNRLARGNQLSCSRLINTT